MSEINSDALVPCPLCSGDGFLTHADKSTGVCRLCGGRVMLHKSFVALCYADGQFETWWYCDVCNADCYGAIERPEPDNPSVICYECFCKRAGIILPVYAAGEPAPF